MADRPHGGAGRGRGPDASRPAHKHGAARPHGSRERPPQRAPHGGAPGKPYGSPAGKPKATPRRDGAQPDPRGRQVPAGYPVRALAVRLVSAVLDRGRALDDALAAELDAGAGRELEARDRGLARLIAATVLRRRGELDAVVARFIERPLPADRGLLSHILSCAAAQLLVLGTPPHAVLNIAVEQCRHDRGARRFDRLANAVLRRVSEQGKGILDGLPGARLDVPAWLWSRWSRAYGEAVTAAVAAASLREAPLDLTLRDRSQAAAWAEQLGATALATGTLRLTSPQSRVSELPGFSDGVWWVQDAAAALPVRLLGDVAGLDVADLCAAPGGKTAQLAAAGARVTAVDLSEDRLWRVRENLARLGLRADVIAADATAWQPGRLLDAVLIDAPCTATGTIRRHPDILHLKRQSDLPGLAELQARMADHACGLLRPGGQLVYCTCSLEPEEGEAQVERLIARVPGLERVPIVAGEGGIEADWITARGDLRTLPCHTPAGAAADSGMDGFYAARLVKH